MSYSSAILSADWHIDSLNPSCRTDDFLSSQFSKIKFILSISKKYNAPIFIAGDLGDKHQWSNWLLRKVIKLFRKHPQKIFATPGQHDLPYHNRKNLKKSGFGVLSASQSIIPLFCDSKPRVFSDYELYACEYEGKIPQVKLSSKRKVLMIHRMIVHKEDLFLGQEAEKAEKFLRKHPEFDLIVSGDNHIPFVSEYKKRLLINPGSLMRRNISQKEHKPRVYLWECENNEIKIIYLPLSDNIFKEDDEINPINRRLEAFVNQVKIECEIGLSFEKNIEEYFRKNNIEKEIKNKIFQMMKKGD